MSEDFFEYLNEVTGFNAGWRSFVDEIRKKNDKSNRRLIPLFRAIKGDQFVRDLRGLMRVVGKSNLLRISRKPAGTPMSDKRWVSIPKIWVDVKSDERGAMSGYMYIEVKTDRFVKVHCSF